MTIFNLVFLFWGEILSLLQLFQIIEIAKLLVCETKVIFPKQCNGLRDHQQLTSVSLNKFYSLSKIHPHSSLFLTDNFKLDGISTKIKWKIYVLLTLYFKFWRCFLWKNFLRYNHRIFYFLLFCISFSTSRYNF